MINLQSMTTLITQSGSSQWLLFGSGIILCIAAIMLLRGTRKLQTESKQVKSIRNDLKALITAAVGVGKRVMELEKRQRNLHDNQEKTISYEPAGQFYDEAAFMAQQGETVEAIMQRCGLSYSEAELVCLMNTLDKVG